MILTQTRVYAPINTNETGNRTGYSQRAIIVLCCTGFIIALNVAMLIATLVNVYKERFEIKSIFFEFPNATKKMHNSAAFTMC